MTYRSPEEPDEYPVYLRNANNHLSRVEPGREHRVGRDARCDVVLIDPTAEWWHAIFVVEGAGLRVRAEPAATPETQPPATFVDDVRVGADVASSALARSGSKIRMAETTLVVETGARVEAEHARRLRERREMRKARVPRSPSGSLEEVPLPDLLALFETSKKSGILVMRRDEVVARIHYERGIILHVNIEDRHATNRDDARALMMELFEWTEGVFDLDPPSDAPPRTVSLRGTELTLEYNAKLARGG